MGDVGPMMVNYQETEIRLISCRKKGSKPQSKRLQGPGPHEAARSESAAEVKSVKSVKMAPTVCLSLPYRHDGPEN